MSQTTQQRNRGGRPGERPRRPRRERVEPEWIPKTILGKKVASGEITEMNETLEIEKMWLLRLNHIVGDRRQ